MGLRNELMECLVPTLKRGANKLCASGAIAVLNKAHIFGVFGRTFHMQSSITIDSMNPQMKQRCYTQSIQASAYIIEYYAPATGEFFELADGVGFGDIE